MKRLIIFFSIISLLNHSLSIEAIEPKEIYESALPHIRAPLILGGAALSSLAAWKTVAAIRTKQQFNPTASNLNLVYLSPSHENVPVKTISDLVNTVNKGSKIENFYLQIKRKNKTILNDQEIWQASNSILNENQNTFFIYSRGIATTDNPGDIQKPITAGKKPTTLPRKGGGVLEAYKYIRDRIISSNCATFDYPDTRGFMSFGQENETEFLKSAYQEILTKHKPKKIVLVGLCRGATTALAYASEKPDKLAGLIVESPLVSLPTITAQMAKSFVMGIPGMGGLMYQLFRFWHPSYEPKKDNLLGIVENISSDVPILIGHLKNDLILSDDALHKLMKKFEGRKNVYLAVIDDKTDTLRHGTLSLAESFQKVCAAFKSKHSLDSKSLNEQDEYLLNEAKENAQADDPKNWKMVVNQ